MPELNMKNSEHAVEKSRKRQETLKNWTCVFEILSTCELHRKNMALKLFEYQKRFMIDASFIVTQFEKTGSIGKFFIPRDI